MSRPKHTPGNWTFQKNYHHDRFDVKAPIRKTYIGSINIDRDHADFSPEEATANANLVATAPELYVSLKALTTELSAMAQDQGVYFPETLKRLMHAGLDVLSKVDGGTT